MAASDLILNVSTDKYSAKISQLEGYVQSLHGIVQQYEVLRGKIDSEQIWTDAEATEYKVAIEKNIARVNEAIEATNLNIQQLQNLLQNMEATRTGIRSTIEESIKLAENLFT